MKTLQGTVVSDVNNKTIIVNVATSKNHPLYKKRYTTTKKYAAHDEKNQAKIGDIVIISETRPVSKQKTWKLDKIVGQAEMKHQDAPLEAEEA
ncbi:30S ribosomal protein S17 [Candidatus Saccharibacteria bacterium]|nr:30S ribosomal protein S17 [Candidatus Saccharibacteria bacterium]MCB9821548.1 30S ribosomal protein S17 [Candidatus Nomurabacteria bacterium]